MSTDNPLPPGFWNPRADSGFVQIASRWEIMITATIAITTQQSVWEPAIPCLSKGALALSSPLNKTLPLCGFSLTKCYRSFNVSRKGFEK